MNLIVELVKIYNYNILLNSECIKSEELLKQRARDLLTSNLKHILLYISFTSLNFQSFDPSLY